MPKILSSISVATDEFKANAAAMRALVEDLAAKRAEAAAGGPERLRERHTARGKLLPRDRVLRLIDPGSPFLELSPLAAETWAALGVAPRPSFVLGALVRRERPEPEAPLVRMPLEVRYASITELRGTVLGPGDVALMGALVELPALQIRTRTDARGRFRFASVPRDPKELHLLVQAKGRQFQVVVEQDGADGEPVVIRVGPFDRKEN